MKFYRILIITIFAYTLISCGGADERKSVYMNKAKASIKAGDLDKARIELKNALQIDPKNGEAYYQIASVFEQQKKYSKAYANYRKAEELSPELLANHAKLGRFYLLLMNDVEKAQEKIDLILSKEPDNKDGLLLKAAMLLRSSGKGNVEEAIELVKSIIAKNPDHIESMTFLATLYVKNKNNKEAIKVLDLALKNNKNNERINKLLALVLIEEKKYERAEAIYKKFLEDNPNKSSSYNNLAGFYGRIDETGKAEKILRSSIDNDPNDEDRILTLVKYINATKGVDEGVKELNSFASDNNKLGKIRLALAELLLRKGEKEKATKTYNEVVTDFSEEGVGVSARTALALISIRDKDFAKATETADEALLISPNNPELNFLRAKLALRDKDYEKAIISLRIVTKETPNNIDAFILLANVYKQEDNTEQITATLNSAYDVNKSNATGLLKLAQYHVENDIKRAEKIIDHVNRIKPKNYTGLSIKAIILNKKEQRSEAFNVAKKIMDFYPKKANGYLQAIPYYGEKKDVSSAVSLLEKGYINAKDNRKILSLLTSLQVKEKKFDIVENRLNAELDAKPDDAQLKLMLVKVYLVKKETAPAVKLLEGVIANKPNMEEAYLMLSDIYRTRKDMNSAKNILVKGRLNVEDSPKIAMKLTNIYELEGLYNEAIEVYQNLYKIYPENLLVVNNLASLLSDHGDGKDDLTLAKTLAGKLEGKGLAVFLDTLGWIHYKLGDSQKSVQYLAQATEKAPDINIFNYHLGMAYFLSGNKIQAKTFLEKSLANKNNFKERAKAETTLKGL